MTRRLSLLLALLALALGAPGLAHADDDGDSGRSGDNAAVAVNTKDGSSLFKFAFSLRKVLGEVVDNENAAVAYASCESCRTTAIAIQIVLVVGSPTTVTPANYAIAVNENCTLCQTFASAYQFVIGVSDASVGLSKAGKKELKEILLGFESLKANDFTAAEFKQRTDALAARLREVLRTELVSKRGDDDDDEDDDGDEDEREEDERPAPPTAPTTTAATTTQPESTEPGTTQAGTTSVPTVTESVPATTSTETTPVTPETTTGAGTTEPGTTTTTP